MSAAVPTTCPACGPAEPMWCPTLAVPHVASQPHHERADRLQTRIGSVLGERDRYRRLYYLFASLFFAELLVAILVVSFGR